MVPWLRLVLALPIVGGLAGSASLVFPLTLWLWDLTLLTSSGSHVSAGVHHSLAYMTYCVLSPVVWWARQCGCVAGACELIEKVPTRIGKECCGVGLRRSGLSTVLAKGLSPGFGLGRLPRVSWSVV